MDSEYSDNDRDRLAREISKLQNLLRDTQSRIGALEAKLAEASLSNGAISQPGGTLGGYGKTIGELNYKTIGELNAES